MQVIEAAHVGHMGVTHAFHAELNERIVIDSCLLGIGVLHNIYIPVRYVVEVRVTSHSPNRAEGSPSVDGDLPKAKIIAFQEFISVSE